MKKHLITLLTVMAAVLIAGQAFCKEVNVAAASDLKFAFEEISAAFQKQHPDVAVKTTYGSSGNFYSQMQNKAPFDIFLSADMEFPRKLVEAKLAKKDTMFLYGIGRLVIWAPSSTKIDIKGLGMKALLDPSVRKIAIANPAHAPYGRAAEAAMKKMGVYDRVKDKIVTGDNIAQTAQFVETGAADIGIIALSLAVAPAMQGKGVMWEVPLDQYPKMEQGGVVLNWSKDAKSATALTQFMVSTDGKDILKRYGFYMSEKEPWIGQR